MNAKHLALFAVAIMLAGCAVALMPQDPVDADGAENKTVYVVNGQTAELNLKLTLNALKSYNNTISWTYESTGGSYVDVPTAADKSTPNPPANGTSFSFWMDTYKGETSAGSAVPTDYVLNVKGKAVTETSETIKLRMTISSKVDEDQGQPLVQTIDYKITVNVLPSGFTVNGVGIVYNKVAIGTKGYISPTYDVDSDDYSINSDDYLFYAIGLPSGVAMDSTGKLSGTPNITNWATGGNATYYNDRKTITYEVTVVATHKASNISITSTFDFSVKDVSNVFSVEIEGDKIVESVNAGVYKSIGNIELTIKIGGFDPDKSYDIYAIKYDVSTNAYVQEKIGTIDSIDGIGYTPDGTGEITIVAMIGSEQATADLYVVEPIEDIQTGIGFMPGHSATFPTTVPATE